LPRFRRDIDFPDAAKRNHVVVSDPRFPAFPSRPWWRRRLFKTTVIAILCLTAYYILERQLGEHAWMAYQREAAAKGIKLQYADFETPDIPDEENYAAVPIFRKAVRTVRD
jgi:hypothetical protein